MQHSFLTFYISYRHKNEKQMYNSPGGHVVLCATEAVSQQMMSNFVRCTAVPDFMIVHNVAGIPIAPQKFVPPPCFVFLLVGNLMFKR